MAWVVGLVNDDEIERIKKAGYSIDRFLSEDYFDCEPSENEYVVQIYVDCDVTDLLSMHEEN